MHVFLICNLGVTQPGEMICRYDCDCTGVVRVYVLSVDSFIKLWLFHHMNVTICHGPTMTVQWSEQLRLLPVTDRNRLCHCFDPARCHDKGHGGRTGQWTKTVDFDGKIASH